MTQSNGRCMDCAAPPQSVGDTLCAACPRRVSPNPVSTSAYSLNMPTAAPPKYAPPSVPYQEEEAVRRAQMQIAMQSLQPTPLVSQNRYSPGRDILSGYFGRRLLFAGAGAIAVCIAALTGHFRPTRLSNVPAASASRPDQGSPTYTPSSSPQIQSNNASPPTGSAMLSNAEIRSQEAASQEAANALEQVRAAWEDARMRAQTADLYVVNRQYDLVASAILVLQRDRETIYTIGMSNILSPWNSQECTHMTRQIDRLIGRLTPFAPRQEQQPLPDSRSIPDNQTSPAPDPTGQPAPANDSNVPSNPPSPAPGNSPQDSPANGDRSQPHTGGILQQPEGDAQSPSPNVPGGANAQSGNPPA